MKFDFIIANPPYQGGRHMTFLNEAYLKLKDNGVLVFIHPSTYFISLKGLIKKAKEYSFKECEIMSLELLPNTTFENVCIWVPLSITTIKKGYDNKSEIRVRLENSQEHIFDKLIKVNRYGNVPEIFSLIDKVKKSGSILNYSLTKDTADDYSFFVELPMFVGNREPAIDSILFMPFIAPLSIKTTAEITRNYKWKIFGFKTKNEADNFLGYLRTKFARKLLQFLKLNQHIDRGEMQLIPWLDFSQKWDDEKLAKHFNLTKKEVEIINSLPEQNR